MHKGTAMTYFVQAHQKSDGRTLWLYSQGPRSYTFTQDLPPLPAATPTRRWHQLRGEWVYYNTARNDRPFNPPAQYNPLAPVQPGAYPGEIPVTDFEVAVFDNGFPALTLSADPLGTALPATGHCEVVVYATQDRGSLADFSDAHVALLIEAWGHRVDQLMAREALAYVLPFENRGPEVGVTLPHPHGQIYAFADLPPLIARQAQNQAAGQIIERQSDRGELVIASHGEVRSFVPECARYPFETWLLSPETGPSPSAWQNSKLDMARALKAAVARLDRLFDQPMPLVLWVATAPRGYEATWPCHIQIYPLLRGRNRLKYLAGVEQITGLMLCDVPPEIAAQTLRQIEKTG